MLPPLAALMLPLLAALPAAPEIAAGSRQDIAQDHRAVGTLVFGGDVLPHRSMVESFRAYGPGSLLGPVAPVFRAADVALVNVDSPAWPAGPCPAPDVRFNIDPPIVRELAQSGIDGVIVANNHAHDYGATALGETISSLRAAGIQPVGAAPAGQDAYAPATFPMLGRTLCVFAVARLVNWPVEGDPASRPHIATVRDTVPGEMATLVNAIRQSRARCDGVVVSFHGGIEYHSAPEPAERQFAAQVAEAGADVVIGHHPHTAQPLEMISTHRGAYVPVFYSLGNLVSGQGSLAERGVDPFAGPYWRRPLDPRVREGLLAVVRFVTTPDGRLRVQHAGALPVWTVNTTDEVTRRGRNEVPRITATVMPLPRDSAPSSFLYRRFHALGHLIGYRQIIHRAEVPGVHEADELSRVFCASSSVATASR